MFQSPLKTEYKRISRRKIYCFEGYIEIYDFGHFKFTVAFPGFWISDEQQYNIKHNLVLINNFLNKNSQAY